MAPAAEAPSLRERNRSRTRHDVLDAASRLLDETGAVDQDGVFTLELVGQRAGVSRGTLYTHFPGGRDEIVRSAYQRLSAWVLDRALELREPATTTTDRIRALAQALLDVLGQPGGRFYCTTGQEVAGLLVGTTGRTSTVVGHLIEDDLRTAQEAGALPAGVDVAVLATLLGGAIRAAGDAAARDGVPARALLDGLATLTSSLLAEPAAG
ncbi:TetR/AcrR family transcriptional regulator [Kineococcus sp. SYSU DK001]|uniref:TetR/AcrR family transcriptional regulator n=1 Tax=Kineococcus sp. SYSU DK001 TaxID=3383122 RepID=UPI003D7E6757